MTPRVGFVAIGRNEGERLVACLKSIAAAATGPIVYVDSGSTDDSVARANELGADIVRLDMSVPFTAARARNAGAARLRQTSGCDFIQFIDGDCALVEGWVSAARAFLDANPDVAAVCGRRREIRPDQSVFNRLCDIEWETPIGDAKACGGDVMMRADAFFAVGGYRSSLIAGEEPELCLRLRERGSRIVRLDADMTLHDAAMTRFAEWWKRSMRAGHAFAEVSNLHRLSPQRIWAGETRRAFLWSGVAPTALLLASALSPLYLMMLLAYPAQAARLFLGARRRLGADAGPWAFYTVLGKFAEAAGGVKYFWNRASGKTSALIEYK
jgi:glycosyltransferase involved in cell wall biosynthesis